MAILAGEGKSFCSGWDQNHEEDELKIGAVRPKGILYCDLDWVKKPIICASQGYAIGGGMSLLLGADIRVVSEDAKIGYSQPKIGIISIGGAMRMPEAIPGLARWYMFSGRVDRRAGGLPSGLGGEDRQKRRTPGDGDRDGEPDHRVLAHVRCNTPRKRSPWPPTCRCTRAIACAGPS